MRIGQPAAVEQVRRDCREVGFLWLAVDVGIGKQPLFPGRRFPFVQPDNCHVHPNPKQTCGEQRQCRGGSG